MPALIKCGHELSQHSIANRGGDDVKAAFAYLFAIALLGLVSFLCWLFNSGWPCLLLAILLGLRIPK